MKYALILTMLVVLAACTPAPQHPSAPTPDSPPAPVPADEAAAAPDEAPAAVEDASDEAAPPAAADAAPAPPDEAAPPDDAEDSAEEGAEELAPDGALALYLSSLGATPAEPDFPAMLQGKDVRIIVGETGATVAAAINLQLYLANNGVAVTETRPTGDVDQALEDFDGHTLIIASACGAYSEPLFDRCGQLAAGTGEVRVLKHGSRYIIGFLGGTELDANDAVNAVIGGHELDGPVTIV